LFWFIGGILGPSVLFTRFLEQLFAPIIAKFEEPNMGLTILGSQYRVNYCFWVIEYYRWLKGKNGTTEE